MSDQSRREPPRISDLNFQCRNVRVCPRELVFGVHRKFRVEARCQEGPESVRWKEKKKEKKVFFRANLESSRVEDGNQNQAKSCKAQTGNGSSSQSTRGLVWESTYTHTHTLVPCVNGHVLRSLSWSWSHHLIAAF